MPGTPGAGSIRTGGTLAAATCTVDVATLEARPVASITCTAMVRSMVLGEGFVFEKCTASMALAKVAGETLPTSTMLVVVEDGSTVTPAGRAARLTVS